MAPRVVDRRLFDEITAEQHARLERLAEHRGVRRLKRVYDESQAEVMAKIKQLVRARRGSTMDAHTKRAMLVQIIHGQRFVADQLGDELAAATDDAQRDMLRSLARDLNRLERRYSGSAPVLPIEDVAHFQGVLTGRRGSMLRRHSDSLRKYGGRVVTKVEDELSKSLLQGESQSDAIERVQDAIGGEWWQAERIVRCLPGDTRVTAGVVRAVHRRWYDGDLIEVVTKSGRKLSATPNHPMLTRRGWVRQDGIVPGDYLVCDVGQQYAGSSRNKDVQRGPTPISEVFDSLSAVGVCRRYRGRKPDFHGDRVQGEVDIASPDRELVYGVFSKLTKPSCEKFFALPDHHSGRERFCARCSNLLPYERSCLCEGSDFDPYAFETTRNDALVDAVINRYLRAPFTCLIATADFIHRQVQLIRGASLSLESIPSCFGLGPNIYAGLDQQPLDGWTRPADFGGDAPKTSPARIELDCVVKVSRRSFAGHVFNITTPDGYFAANDIYTGNTELAHASNASQAAGIASSRKVIPDLMMQWRELVSDDGEPLDDRVGIDSLALHGQVVVPGELFRTPARAPDGEQVQESLAYEEIAHPPNRPHDRATVAPWRSGWGVEAWRWGGNRRVPMR